MLAVVVQIRRIRREQLGGREDAVDSDPRDPDGDGAITILDSSLCREQCTYWNCRPSPPTNACGFGAELVPILE